ncbi:MAG: class I SAM-dependent methyltransferase [Syntrophorhabdales bacterium]|jgi:methyltransferase (TIGR00027 family)
MRDQTTSKTALATAYIRAAHQLLDEKPLLLDDPVALTLLGPQASDTIHGGIGRHQSPAGKSLRAHVVLRARFTEDKLEAAVAKGVTRYIMIGAGFDTFALRQPSWAKTLKIVEVDHPATQSAKRERIVKSGFSEPGNLIFCPANFEHEGLGEILARHSILPDKPAFFSWLGVTMYLEEAAIDATLRAVAAFAPGSEISLTFRQPLDDASTTLAARVSDLGEPFVSFFTPEDIEAKLLSLGFFDIDFLTPERAESLYFDPLRTDLPVPTQTSILCAAVH